MATTKNKALEAVLAEALRTFDIETFERRFRDRLDFHDLPVWSLRKAVADAFERGYEQGRRDACKPAAAKGRKRGSGET